MPEIDIQSPFKGGLIPVPREHLMRKPFCMCDLKRSCALFCFLMVNNMKSIC